jgi:hypothetical protein
MDRKQIEKLLAQLQAQRNSMGLGDFLGLSPGQMHIILCGSLEDIRPILSFNPEFDKALLADVPVVTHATLLIKLIAEAGEAKATQNGFLPKKIVNVLCEPHPMPVYSVQSEEYEPRVLALRHAVTACGWLKKKNRKFSLTKKGQLIFEKGFTPYDYARLLQYWLRSYRWSFADRYPECPIIQQAAVFSLYILRQEGRELIPSKRIAELFMRAFPTSLDMLRDKIFVERPPEEELAAILRLRFLERFAAYFGLVNYSVDLGLSFFERDERSQVVLTKLFSEVLCWFGDDKLGSGQMPDDGDDQVWH